MTNKSTSKPRLQTAAATSRRLSPKDREQAIIAGAVAFFAEHGFDGTTRDLAASLNITQPLLYRYFPSKEALLDRVYEHVYLSRWNPDWEADLVNRAVPLVQRLCRFYASYSQVILTYEWVRLFMFAGLKGLDFNRRYLAFLREHIFEKIVKEIRAAHGLDEKVPVRIEELELIWGLHAAIFYLGVRQYIYHMPVPSDLDADIALKVQAFLDGVPATFRRLAQATPAPEARSGRNK